ncbi:MAG: endonuclease [Muribaculaceae bacterium]|nr:endonuclease [Muribaculaceae bacterium]
MKSIHRFLLFVAAVAVSAHAVAEIPQGYYSSLNGKADGNLKTAIFKLVRNFTQVSSYSALPQYFQKTDVYPNSSRWWDMYSDIVLYAPSFKGLNREHSFPKSWWGGSTTVPAYVDLNHLYPSEMAANTAKSNYPLGMVDRSYNVNFQNGISTVGYPVSGQGGGAKYVFEPDDEFKGDFARTYFYMASAYQDLTWKYTYMVSQNLWPTLNSWSVDLLLKWHRDDPVSEKETLRNEAVYKIQNNRNPFIDYPQLAEYIWGNKRGTAFDEASGSIPAGDPTLITPVQDMALDFGQVALGKSVTAQLFFKGENLTVPLALLVYRNDKDMFSIPTRSIAPSLVNSADGYWLTVTYTPTALGTHTSRLLIQDGGLPGSRGIELRGECLPVPTLSTLTATAATSVTGDSYVANWNIPDGETVDYYVVTRTQYRNGTSTTEELLAEENSLLIEGFDINDSESYSVQSVRLGYRSPMSNVVFVNHSGIADTEADQPLVVTGYEGGMRFSCSVPQSGVVIYDSLGRIAAAIDSVDGSTDIAFSRGVYLVVSDQCRRPVKVVVR